MACGKNDDDDDDDGDDDDDQGQAMMKITKNDVALADKTSSSIDIRNSFWRSQGSSSLFVLVLGRFKSKPVHHDHTIPDQ